MNKLMIVVKKDLRETFRTKAFYVSLGIVVFVMVMMVQGMGEGINVLLGVGNILDIQAFLGTIAFMLSLMLMMLFCIYINAYTLTMEKIKHSIESLLCTPLSLRQIYLGKTLALFLPSLILGWLFTFCGVVGINQLFIVPKLGQFVLPGAAPLVAILVIMPIIFFFLCLLIVDLQLIIVNVRWVNTALLVVIFAISFGLSPILRFGAASWSIVLVSLGVAVILAIIVFLLSPRVTKERIILNSKG